MAVPYHKPDISIPADIVEEILRIDGLDNIAIPEAITITPSVEDNYGIETYTAKIAGFLVGMGFHEIMTNSITNSAYYSERELETTVTLLNNLSADLNCMRPYMLEPGLESIAYNLNRKNIQLRFFEFGRTYRKAGPGKYEESEHLCIYMTGKQAEDNWRIKASPLDLFVLKGAVSAVMQVIGTNHEGFETLSDPRFEQAFLLKVNGKEAVRLGLVNRKTQSRFDIKQPVFFADFDWGLLANAASTTKQVIREIPRYPSVQRDLAIVVPRELPYEKVEQTVHKIRLNKLKTVKLFDIFESEKLGEGKKSMAINFTFLDDEKTLTDKEIENWMNSIISALETDLQAEIRK